MKSSARGSSKGRRLTPTAVHAVLIVALFVLCGCKGSSSSTTPQPNAQPTLAVVKLSTAGALPAGKKIGAIDVTLTLAPGVTLKSSANPPQTDPGVVSASGAAAGGSLLVANYTAPTSTLPGKVKIGLINSSGFSTGEFVTVNGDIAAGNNIRASDFSAAFTTITDTDTNPLTGLTAGITVDIQ
jgi:hypothetical protein